MGISFVQYDDYQNDRGSSTVANDIALSTTTGNLIVALISAYSIGADVTGVTDTAGNTYVKAIYNILGSSETIEIWYAENITGNANNITTATFTGSANYRYISVSEYSGVATTSSLDDTAGNLATSASITSTDATSSASGALIVGIATNSGGTKTYTMGSGFTTLSSDLTGVYFAAEYKVLGVAGDYATTYTISSTESYGANCAIFKVGITSSTISNITSISGVTSLTI